MSSPFESLREALQHSPDNVPLLLLFGETCLNELQLPEAREAFSRVVRLQAGHPEARLGLARVVNLEGKTSEAVVRLEQLIEEHPTFAPAQVELSRILAAEGDLARAKEVYQKARQLDPKVADAGLEKELAETKSEPRPESDRRKAGLSSTGEPFEPSGGDDTIPLGGAAFDLGLADMEKPKLNFSDVGGMDAVKETIRMRIIYPLQHANLFKAYDKKPGGGVLLYGPPGCGKTLLSKATAGEIKANFISLGLHQILDMWMGNSEKNMHEVFQLARQNAPCVLFFDEVDALAADRRDLRQSAGRNLINQLLSEMDGADSNNEGVLILGATNAPWHIDPPFAGRAGSTAPFSCRRQTSPLDPRSSRFMSRKKPMGELDAQAVARKTNNFSGADLKAVFDLATEDRLNDAMKTGQVSPIHTKDLLKACAQHQPTTKAWFESARNYALYSNQGGFYDDILKYLGLIKK